MDASSSSAVVGSARVTGVRARALSIPFKQPLMTASFPIPAIDTVLTEIETNAGVKGVSWIFAFGKKRVGVLKAMVEDLGDLALGEDPFMTERLWMKMYRAVGFVGRQGIAALGMAAIDTACWDLAGKLTGQPVYKLLGGSRSEVEAYASEGLWLDRSRDDLVREAEDYVQRGFQAMKMRAGLADEDEDVARVRAVREAIGPDVKLMVDANQAWDVKQAIRMGKRLEEFNLFWLEEPLPYDNVPGFAQVAAALELPICTGETNFFKADFVKLIEARAADILMPDLMRMGGVTEWLKAARLCEAYQVPVTPHLFMEVSAHLAAASPNVFWQEFQPWWEPILVEPVDFHDGAIHLRDRPGFGIEIDEARVKQYELR
ncbi:MAG: mandelate racemase/muconate lactonizing enzyme family protein [Chloroflexi bacterium]|nr:mandelate racemase/muconate lactonizing enzyme family protein [Chloroflexota bacterium]